MSIALGLGEHVLQRRLGALRRVRLDAQPGGDLISRAEAETGYFVGESIGVRSQYRDGLGTVVAIDPGRLSGTDAVGLQEDQDLANPALASPGALDPRRPFGADARDLGQPLGLSLDDLEGSEAETIHQTPRHHFADAGDQAGAEIALQPAQRSRLEAEAGIHPELSPELAVVSPFALQPQAFSGPHTQ